MLKANYLKLFGRPSGDLKIEQGPDTAIQRAEIARLFVELAQAHHALGQHRQALMVAIVGMEPSNASELRKDGDLLTLMGLSYLKLGELRMALKFFDAAAKADPEATIPLLNRVSIQLKHLDLEASAALLRDVLERDPEHYWARVTLPVALRRLDKSEEALKMLDDLVKESPNRPEGHFNRCVIGQAEWTKSKEEVSKALGACQDALKRYKRRTPEYKELRKRVQGIKDALEFM